jgi:hypothetical protein
VIDIFFEEAMKAKSNAVIQTFLSSSAAQGIRMSSALDGSFSLIRKNKLMWRLNQDSSSTNQALKGIR